MMRARLKCENPDDIEFTMTITMRAKEWETLREQLKSGYPSLKLASHISDLLGQARKIYWTKDVEDTTD